MVCRGSTRCGTAVETRLVGVLTSFLVLVYGFDAWVRRCPGDDIGLRIVHLRFYILSTTFSVLQTAFVPSSLMCAMALLSSQSALVIPAYIITVDIKCGATPLNRTG
ncbi:hypothetical protein CC86DRAFT_69041 [Ophiobolus disseminans]|uniref:Uncharacterized protein n=1 Tax=Ophiobolus disseminans TaxID=1469910 RepID=A0A6A6ZRU0_9PLEO|nr:hypothetical protein CC86DRAFT_69041 [Ophiobolus disseminans]